jgi:hypothetical protein
MRKGFLAVMFLVISALLFAQQTMTNDAVIKLVKAGLSDDLIVATINAQAGKYDTSVSGLIALKTAGASDKVVSAIVIKASGSAPAATAPASPAAAAATDPDDPASPHDPGVYFMTTTPDGKTKMVFMDQVGVPASKTSGMMGAAFSFGIAKAKVKVDLVGGHAALRTGSNPVFYMYFPPAVNLGGLGGTDVVHSPAQFALLLLEDKKDHRETMVAKVGMGSQSTGNDEKRTFQFRSERLRAEAYKVTTLGSLQPGEYAFLATTKVTGTLASATYIVYDFGVDGR